MRDPPLTFLVWHCEILQQYLEVLEEDRSSHTHSLLGRNGQELG